MTLFFNTDLIFIVSFLSFLIGRIDIALLQIVKKLLVQTIGLILTKVVIIWLKFK